MTSMYFWDYLVKINPSFQPKGSIGAMFSDILPHIIKTKEERELFLPLICDDLVCEACGDIDSTCKRENFPLFDAADLNKRNLDLQLVLDDFFSSQKPTSKICSKCSSTLWRKKTCQRVPQFMFVELPCFSDNQVAELLANSHENPICLEPYQLVEMHRANRNNHRLHVMEGIKVPSFVKFGDSNFKLTAAVRGRHDHFTVAVSSVDGGEFFCIDDLKDEIQSGPYFGFWNTDSITDTYVTREQDGYFIFLFEIDDLHLQSQGLAHSGNIKVPSIAGAEVFSKDREESLSIVNEVLEESMLDELFSGYRNMVTEVPLMDLVKDFDMDQLIGGDGYATYPLHKRYISAA